MYIISIRERKRKGVTMTCLDEQGNHHRVDREFTPHFFVVDLPPRYRKDHRTAVIEPVPGLLPYIGYTSKPPDVLKFTTHERSLPTWSQVFETRTPLTRQFLEANNMAPGWNDLSTGRLPEKTDTPNLNICSFDIECYSQSRAFPDPSKPSDCVTMIAMSFQRLHGGPIHNHVLSLDATSFTEGSTVVEQFKTEEELLQRFAQVVSERDPDVLTGYNIDNFDMHYIDARLQDKTVFYQTLSRYPDMTAKLHAKMFRSKQKGEIKTSRWQIPGRFCIDLLPLVRAHNATLKYDKKYKSCKLDDVCKQELNGASKTGFTYEDIFRAHETKDNAQNRKLVEYNIQDCILVLQLQSKLQFILTALQMSEISFTPIDDVLHCGVTARITNLLSRTVHAAGYYFNQSMIAEETDAKPFQGAHCFPVVKAIHKKPILGVDFASLYPSIIRRYNIDPSTLVLSKAELLPTDTSMERTLSDSGTETATFITGKPLAPIPTLLRDLGEARTAVKKRLKTDKHLYAVLNAKQMAIKVCMNSFYGFLGSTSFGHRELGASVTAYGRDLIRGTADHILENYSKSVVVGGDSVTGDTPLLLKLPDGSVDIKTIETLGGGRWTEYGGGDKEQCVVDVQVWSDQGWNKVIRVIRHETSKQMYRICTHTGFVDVTEDHSLLLENGQEVKPKDVTIGTNLLHSFPEQFETTVMVNVTKEEAFYLGVSFADTEKDKFKKVPQAILNGTREVRRSFLDGCCATSPLDFCVKGKLGAQGVYYVIRSLGYKHVTITLDKPNLFRIKNGKLTKHPHAIKKIIRLPPQSTFVYDIETTNGHFGAGVGQMVVHNTDSVYFSVGDDEDLKECFRVGEEICKAINDKYGYPIVLEMEKVYYPMLYLAKKSYAAIMYESPTDTPTNIDIKGIAVARGACSAMTRKTQLDVIKAVFASPTNSWQVVKDIIREAIFLLRQKAKGDLVKTVKLGAGYKNPSRQISVCVVEKMVARGQEEPTPGERVPYLVAKSKKRKRITDHVDHPDYISKNDLDYDYYVDSQILKPLKRFLDILQPNWKKDDIY